jgi:type VI secretion system FHA domain protein
MGSAILAIVSGLTELMNVRAEVKRELRAPDRTMLASHNNNPLKSEMPLEEIVQYVLFNPKGVGGYMPVNKALKESIDNLRAHEFASVAAVRAAVEGSVKEFAPEKLRSVLLKGKSKLPQVLDNARLWDMYTVHYQNKSQHMADWLEHMFNYYFMPVYSRESERLLNKLRESTPP